jgi:hypothetical protein
MATLNIGDVIIDNHDRVGIVFSKERRPSMQWLAQQNDVRTQTAAGPWWKVLPLTGGAVILPDDLGTFVRRATIDDVLSLFDSQYNAHAGQVTLIELLQELRRANADRKLN